MRTLIFLLATSALACSGRDEPAVGAWTKPDPCSIPRRLPDGDLCFGYLPLPGVCVDGACRVICEAGSCEPAVGDVCTELPNGRAYCASPDEN